MRLVNHLYVRDYEGWKGIYNPFGHKVAFLTEKEWEMIKKKEFSTIDSELVSFLKDNNFIVEDEFFEKNWLKERHPLTAVRFNSMYLITTTECNLNCKYCVVLGNEDLTRYPKKYMTQEVGRAALKVFKEQLDYNRQKKARVTFYGGEPTLNKELILDLVPEISELNYKNMEEPVEIVMITNGYKFDREIASVLREHMALIGVSIDGMKKHHDIARIDNQGNVTFDKVIENFKKYQDAGIPVSITTTIGSHNIEDLPQIAEYFATELKPEMVEFQLPCQIPTGNKFIVPPKKIAEKLMEANEVLQSHGIIEATTYRRMGHFIAGDLYLTACGSNGGQLVVAPDGMMGPCHSLVGSRKYFTGNVLKGTDPAKLPNFMEWANRYPLHMPDCHGCSFLTICGGGCTYNGYITHDSIWGKDLQNCGFIKGMIDWLLDDVWEKVSD